MLSAQLEIQIIASIVAVACALPGVFLVLRRMAMMSDAISHSILLGIVLAFFITKDLNSPFLIVAAALTGVVTVSLVELVHRTRLVKADAAIGLIFPVLFSLGVILLTRHAGNVHLDTDAVLLGELAFAPFDRFEINGVDLGPKALYVMSVIMLLNIAFIALFYKELKLATFDSALAAAIGFSPGLIHYGLMSVVSVTAVGAFDAVGAILVVSLMVGPPVSAYLLTDNLAKMIFLSVLTGILSAISGYWLAHLFDVSIAGSMATMVGIIFGLVFAMAPDRGLIAIARRRARQKNEFALSMLLVHLLNHQKSPEESRECRVAHLPQHLHWNKEFLEKIIYLGEKEKSLTRKDEILNLTTAGVKNAERSMTR